MGGLSFTSTSSIIKDITMSHDTTASMTSCGYPTAHGPPLSTCETIPIPSFDPLGSEVTNWWEDYPTSDIDAGLTESGLLCLQDELLRLSEQNFSPQTGPVGDRLRWNTYSPLTWTSEECDQLINSVPRALKLQEPRTFASSTTSSSTSGIVYTSSNAEATSSIHDPEMNLRAEKSALLLRHALPSSLVAVPAITRGDTTANRSKKRPQSTTDSTDRCSRSRSSRTAIASTDTRYHAVKTGTSTTRLTSLLETSPGDLDTSSANIQVPLEAPTRRDPASVAKDQYLLEARKAGLSYKVIRAQGKFSEAESTLRGRHRSLVKKKKARIRKPEWTKKDVGILALVPDDNADYEHRIDCCRKPLRSIVMRAFQPIHQSSLGEKLLNTFLKEVELMNSLLLPAAGGGVS
ncbi:hypothetical protein ACMFMF_008128 [Clarireedia jacksonii]